MTIFSKIISGQIPCYKIAENENFIAFLDIMPLCLGHTLVVPKIEIDRLFDLPSEVLENYLPFCRPIAKAIKLAFPCNRINIITIGLEVPHCHIHLIPTNTLDDLNFSKPKMSLTQDELLTVHKKNPQLFRLKIRNLFF